MGAINPNSRARSWVLQFLYGWEAQQTNELTAVSEASQRQRRVNPRYRPHIERLVAALAENMEQVDQAITASMPNWRIDRLSVIDRSILRIGTAELLLFDDIPPLVSIHEAIQLAEKYGSEESPRFVNGVLDAVYRSLSPNS
ncbi:MAG: transcription antitermination factor NusB [Gemmatimonadota bacterium]